MSTSDRRPYETATVLDQELLDNSHDNLACDLRMVAEIEGPAGTIRISDVNTYKGNRFYPALVKFPIIERTVGEWLSVQIEFSALELSNISNVDGRFNNVLPQGLDFDGWIGRPVKILIGLRDVESTYRTVFSGFVSTSKGLSRGIQSISISARDRLDDLNNATFPDAVFKVADFPYIENTYVGKIIPLIYGNWTQPEFLTKVKASIPAIPVNSLNPDVEGVAKINVQYYISLNQNIEFLTDQVFLKRSDKYYQFNSADIVNVPSQKNSFEIVQNGLTTIETTQWEFEVSDNIFVRVKGKQVDAGGLYTDNIVEIARDILKTYSNVVDADFDAKWDTYRDKASPAESAIKDIKARAYIGEGQEVMQYALSLLEQVRLEPFINKDLKISLFSLHLDDFIIPANISHTVRETDLVESTLKIDTKERTNITRARARFNFVPDLKENLFDSAYYRNQAAIDQAGLVASKDLSFPNLYNDTAADIRNQLIEILKLSSAGLEDIRADLTWRSLLLDIGESVKLNLNVGSTIFNDAPCLIREIGYDPEGMKIPVRLFSLQMVPYDTYNPAYNGIVGGTTATITEE